MTIDASSESGRLSKRSRNTFRIYGVVLSVGVCCALAIVTTYQATLPIINEKRLAQRSAAVADLLPLATSIIPYRLDAGTNKFEIATGEAQGANIIFVGIDSEQRSIGAVIETRGMGYQDYIRLLYAYSFQQQAIMGIHVLESRETPGLGDRIESDRTFLNNFAQLEVRVTEDGQRIAHPIEFVKPGEKVAGWQIDGITGATISSRAVANMLNTSTIRWIPTIYANRSDFSAAQDPN